VTATHRRPDGDQRRRSPSIKMMHGACFLACSRTYPAHGMRRQTFHEVRTVENGEERYFCFTGNRFVYNVLPGTSASSLTISTPLKRRTKTHKDTTTFLSRYACTC
jgi:hypothetical protein